MKPGLGLGKGLGALIPKDVMKQERSRQTSLTGLDDSESSSSIALIEIDKIIGKNPMQPRQDFDNARLEELARSIAIHGVITPITVRKHFDGYELISGERRVRASKLAGLQTIPAYIIEVNTNAQMLEIALIENVQRENLNPLEVALGYQLLIDECGLKQDDVATRVGKDRSTVANMLRLLRLPPEIQSELRNGTISMGHARALLALSTEASQVAVLSEIVTHDLSVRRTEALVKDIELGRKKVEKNGDIVQGGPVRRQRIRPEIEGENHAALQDIESSLRHLFGTQVRIRMKNETQGSVDIEFFSVEELERLLELFTTLDSKA